jgi:hypothetical protein
LFWCYLWRPKAVFFSVERDVRSENELLILEE